MSKKLLVLSVLVFTFAACAGTEQVVNEITESKSFEPSWYNAQLFWSDSTAIYAEASAIESDSVVAVANAELQARANIEHGIAVQLEEARLALEESGINKVTENEFLITLRNTHQQVEELAQKSKGEAVQKEGYYRGYARVSYTQTELKALLEKNLNNGSSLWESWSSSQ